MSDDPLARLIAAVRGRAEAADALWRRGETTSLSFEAGRLKAAGTVEEAGMNLRVVADGRVGIAGTTAADNPLEPLVARALASAALGEPIALTLPESVPVPRVETYAAAAAAGPVDALVALGRELVERLTRDGCQVNAAVERHVGATAVANTAGATGGYEATTVSVSAEITRIAGDDVLMIYDYYTGVDLPTRADVDALVRSIETRLERALTITPPPEGSVPVVFSPFGFAVLALPLEQGLSGKTVLQGISPLAGRVGDGVFDAALSVVDDPLTPGRAGSRPFDDEGVPSARLALIDGGTVAQFIYDLETAGRAGVSSTGHGNRGIFGKPRPGYTNLMIGPSSTAGVGSGTLGGGLLGDISDGLLVDDLIGVGQGNVVGGAFSHPVALAYRVQRGEITGRVKDAAVAGNVYDLLRRVGGWGDDGRWVGGRWSPSVLVEGVAVAGR